MKFSIVALCIVCVLTVLGSPAPAEAAAERSRISVNGEAMVHVEPNEIVITLGIETWGDEVSEAKKENERIVRDTIARLKRVGIPRREMRTDHLSIEPRWKSAHRREGFIGYVTRNTLAITVSEVAIVEAVITEALAAGVNYIHNVDFRTTHLRSYRDQARELALNAAREKAEAMAAVFGEKVGRPVTIDERQSPWFYGSPWRGWWGGSRGGGMSQVNVQVDRGGGGQSTDTIALGKLSIRANVSVTFELIPGD